MFTHMANNDIVDLLFTQVYIQALCARLSGLKIWILCVNFRISQNDIDRDGVYLTAKPVAIGVVYPFYPLQGHRTRKWFGFNFLDWITFSALSLCRAYDFFSSIFFYQFLQYLNIFIKSDKTFKQTDGILLNKTQNLFSDWWASFHIP